LANGNKALSLQRKGLADTQRESQGNQDLLLDLDSQSDHIDPAILNDSSASTPTTETHLSTPTPTLLALHQKRKRGREEDGRTLCKTKVDKTIAGLEMVSGGLQAIAQARITSTQNDVSEAISLLLQVFTKAPRKLSADHIQKAIDFLSAPTNAIVFISFAKQPGMEEH
jgi:hypothetical protein